MLASIDGIGDGSTAESATGALDDDDVAAAPEYDDDDDDAKEERI